MTRDLRECRTLAAFCRHTESRAWPLVEIWPCVTRTNARAHTRIQKHAHRLTPSHTRTAEHCTCTDGNTHSRSHLANPSPSFLRVHKHIHSHSLPRSLTTHARTHASSRGWGVFISAFVGRRLFFKLFSDDEHEGQVLTPVLPSSQVVQLREPGLAVAF